MHFSIKKLWTGGYTTQCMSGRHKYSYILGLANAHEFNIVTSATKPLKTLLKQLRRYLHDFKPN